LSGDDRFIEELRIIADGLGKEGLGAEAPHLWYPNSVGEPALMIL